MSQWNHISTTKPWKGSKLQFTTKINPRKGTRRFQSSPPHYLRTCLSWKVPVEHKALVVLYPSSCPLASHFQMNGRSAFPWQFSGPLCHSTQKGLGKEWRLQRLREKRRKWRVVKREFGSERRKGERWNCAIERRVEEVMLAVETPWLRRTKEIRFEKE